MSSHSTTGSFEALNEHIKLLDPTIEKFCLDNNFIKDMITTLDRYPSRRMTCEKDINMSIDVFMNMKKPGKYFEEFFPEIPYTILCGMWCDHNGKRYFLKGGHAICDSLPFNIMEMHIEDFLQQAIDYFADKDRSFLLKHGSETDIIN